MSISLVLQNTLLSEALKYPNISLKSQVYPWDEDATALTDIQNVIKDKEADNIFLIGHSYGGDTANDLADELGQKGIKI